LGKCIRNMIKHKLLPIPYHLTHQQQIWKTVFFNYLLVTDS